MQERGTIPDVRAIRLSGERGDEVSTTTLLVFVWTSLVTATLAFEIVWAARTALLLVVDGGPPASIASAALFAALPIPGVVVYTSVWWRSLRAPGGAFARALSTVVPLAVGAGALAGLALG